MLTLLFLVLVIVLIIVTTTRFKLHPFLTLVLAAVLMGFIGGLNPNEIMSRLTEGFGSTLNSIGIVIACGTIIGTFLEKSGAAYAMASCVLKLVGEKRSPLALSITGYIVSIPVFCDSGFVILAALNKALARKTGLSLSVLAVALATGLYTTHVFVPPTPGPLAAAATLEADFGLIILLGLIVGMPTAVAGLLWALYYCRRFQIAPTDISETTLMEEKNPTALASFTPLIIPIILIALKSIAGYPTKPFGTGFLLNLFGFIGHPVMALIIGVFLSFNLKAVKSTESNFDWISTGLKNAGIIILITGAGGAFGNVLRAALPGDIIGAGMAKWQIGIFLPFLSAAVLKTAQGSSTVAMITTSALVAPLLPAMGFASPIARALVALAIGAGSMTVSHVNDSYFWVVSQFSNMDTTTALHCHTIATLVQGIIGIFVIALLAWIFV